MPAVGVGELLAAVRLAWSVYNACQAAPQQFKALSEEVEALHIVLESINEVVLSVGLDASKADDLSRLFRGCTTVLTDLDGLMVKYKSLAGSSKRTWDRLRWGRENIDPLRTRLISNVSLLSAFNSSLMHASQTSIITRLDQVLTDIQGERKTTSSTSYPDNDTMLRIRDNQENHDSASPWINQATEEGPGQIEVVSATYGTLDVTIYMQEFFHTRLNSLQAFTPTNAFFGTDPIPNFVKAFILVWRMVLPSAGGSGTGQSYSIIQTERCLEGQPVILNSDASLPRFTPPAIMPRRVLILNASYYTVDVTALVVRIIALQKERPLLVVQASIAQFGFDPAPNTRKQLSITYAYRSPDGYFDHHTQVVGDGDTIAIPSQYTIQPKLAIHAAYWADMDVTHLLRTQVSHDQTLQIDTHRFPAVDPWYNVSKTLSVMYQYADGPLQLTVCHDSSGTIFIRPTSHLRRNFFNPAGRFEGKNHILAVVWGTMDAHPEPLDASQFRWIAEGRKFRCTNEWFGFDGRPNWPKTCHVFYEHGTTAAIRCMAVREGQECCLPEFPL